MYINQAVAKNLIEILLAVTQICRTEIKHLRGELKVTFTQFKILSAIRRDIAQVSLLCEELNTCQPAMSKMVDGMVKSGFLIRSSSTSDRRKIRINLTVKGEAAYNAVHKRICATVTNRLHSLPKAEQKKADVMISRLLSVLK